MDTYLVHYLSIQVYSKVASCAYSVLIYVNDILDSIVNFPFLFIYDTKPNRFVSSFNDQILIQNDLDSLLSWCTKWKVKVSLTKTVALLFSLANSSCSPSFKLMDHQIDVNISKDLCRDQSPATSHGLTITTIPVHKSNLLTTDKM